MDNILSGTLNPQTSSQPSSQQNEKDTEAARKRRESLRRGVISLYGRGFDERSIRQKAYEKGGFDPAEIDSVLGEYKQMRESDFSGSPAKPAMTQQDIDTAAKEKLGTGDLLKQYYMARDVIEGLKQYRDLYTQVSQDNTISPTEFSGKDAAVLKAKHKALMFNIAQAEGTGALQEADKKLVEELLPDVSSANPLAIAGQELRGGREGNIAAFNDVIEQMKDRVARLSGVDRSLYDKEEFDKKKQEISAQTPVPPEQPDQGSKLVDPITGEIKSGGFFDTLGNIGEAIGSFTGGNKIGEAIGDVVGSTFAKYGEAGDTFKNTIAMLTKAHQEGKLSDEKFQQMLDVQEKVAKDAFGYSGPSFREFVGDVAKSAINVLGGAEVKGATALATIGKSALWGASYSAANAQAEGKSAKETAMDTAIGAALGGGIATVGKAVPALVRKFKGTNTPAEAIGEILQGKTKDLSAGQKVFAVLDKKGIKTYEDLGQRVDSFVGTAARKLDEVLGSEQGVKTLDQLSTLGKTQGGKEVKTNYVEKALEQLNELYTKIGDNVEAGNMSEVLDKARTQGLTNLEVNQIARKYGIEFGDKAFSKLGDPLTSVNAQMYENVRKGLKDVARSGVTGEQAKNLDSLISDAIQVRGLVRKNIEKINALDQRVANRGWGDKIGRGLGIVADTATGGIVSNFFKKLIVPSNVGFKTLNALDLEERLSKNLSIIEKASKAENPGELISFLKGVNRTIIGKSKKIRPGMSIQDVSGGKAGYAQKLNPDDAKALTDYIDAVRLKKLDTLPEGKAGAEYIFERLGINQDQSTTKLANIAEDILTGKRDASVLYKTGREFKGIPKKGNGEIRSTIVSKKEPLLEEARKYASPEEFVKAQGKTLYHGTPYDFDKFDISKMNTGEMNQSFGKGLYLSDSPNVANYYKNTITKSPEVKIMSFDGKPISKEAQSLLSFGWNKNLDEIGRLPIEQQKTELVKAISKVKSSAQPSEYSRKIIQELENIDPESLSLSVFNSKIMNVAANTKALKTFLDFSKKPSEKQISSLKKRLGENYLDWDKIKNGDELFSKLNRKLKNPEKILEESGIYGIRYDVGTISGGREAGNNYVFFRDSDLKTKSQLTDIWKKAHKK